MGSTSIWVFMCKVFGRFFFFIIFVTVAGLRPVCLTYWKVFRALSRKLVIFNFRGNNHSFTRYGISFHDIASSVGCLFGKGYQASTQVSDSSTLFMYTPTRSGSLAAAIDKTMEKEFLNENSKYEAPVVCVCELVPHNCVLAGSIEDVTDEDLP